MPKVAENIPAGHAECRFAKFADGKTYRWDHGEDFQCKPETLRNYAYRWAWRNGFHPIVRMRGESVYIAFRKDR